MAAWSERLFLVAIDTVLRTAVVDALPLKSMLFPTRRRDGDRKRLMVPSWPTMQNNGISLWRHWKNLARLLVRRFLGRHQDSHQNLGPAYGFASLDGWHAMQHSLVILDTCDLPLWL